MARIASPTFIGRSAELAELDAALDAATQGNPTAVLIGGDAGVGKTRLLATWNDRAVERGARVVSGACLDLGESGPAYVAVLQALRDLLGSLDSAALDEVVGADRAALARLTPELGVGADADDAGLSPTAQTRLFHALVRVLERVSSDRPLVLELEDIHWADPSTRAFLLYLVANARAARLLIVATYRAEETGRDHPVTPLIIDLASRPRATKIDLRPFDVDELKAQLVAILGQPPTKRLLAAIQGRSEGNALFAEELVASSDPAGELPSSIGAALLKRTGGLSLAAQYVLRVASVAGRSAHYDVLRSSTALDTDQLDAALREAVDANILEPAHATERFRFRHALLQEAIYQDTLPGERRRLHAAVAEAMERIDAGAGQSEPAYELAHHWYEAKDHERAFTASLLAGDTAVRQAAYPEALYHLERVLGLWDVAPLGRAMHRRAEVLERATRCAWLAGELEKTVTYARKALDELDAADDPVVRVRVLEEITLASHNLLDETVYDEILGQTVLDGLPPREQIMVMDSRVRALTRSGDRAAAHAAALEAIRIAEAVDDPVLKGDAHLILAGELMEARDLDSAIREALVAYQFASVAGNIETAVEAQQVIYIMYDDAGQYEKAIAAARAAGAYAQDVGLARLQGPWASYYEAEALFAIGQIAASSQVIAAALLDTPKGWAFRVTHVLAARVSIARGYLHEAANHLELARIPGATDEQAIARGYFAIARAEFARAEARLEDVRSIVSTSVRAILGLPAFADMSEMIWRLVEIGLDSEATRAEVGRASGDAEALSSVSTAAGTFLEFLQDVRRQRDAAGVHGTVVQRRYELLIEGHLARIEGRDEPSVWVTAAEMFPPSSVGALTARYRQAEAMLATRVPREEIRAVMAEAHAAAVEIGAEPLARQFEALARRARIDLRPAGPAASDDAVAPPDEAEMPGTAALRGRGLSDREIEVLTLVSAGWSNQAIGDRLFITDKTASVHVSHILAKLGASSRTEAATIGVRLGLPDVERDDGTG